RHTGRTDIPLTPRGEEEARMLRPSLANIEFDSVLCSPLGRARETCELAGLAEQAALRDELLEWDYGDYEGITSEQIRDERPDWVLWRDGCPGGESPAEIGARADVVVSELLATPGKAIVFAHGHMLRVLAARWLGLEVADGRLLALGTGTLSELGWEHENRVIRRWNAPA
ncbi:MAG: histidine phosphatase family protein, partial [Solirubrobacterales bacterium]|nr:histidine phosphatase family protein [Solirubrobacterales bacterium]